MVKQTALFVSHCKGVNGNKKINGRKRHIITDILGLVWAVVDHAAHQADGVMAHKVVITRPRNFLFERQNRDQYNTRSAQQVFKQVLHKAESIYNWHSYGASHSYANCILENGMEIKFIGELLGHRSRQKNYPALHACKQIQLEECKKSFR